MLLLIVAVMPPAAQMNLLPEAPVLKAVNELPDAPVPKVFAAPKEKHERVADAKFWTVVGVLGAAKPPT